MAAPIQGLGGPACLTPARCSVFIRHFLPPLYCGHTGLCFLNRLTLLLSESLLLTDFFFFFNLKYPLPPGLAMATSFSLFSHSLESPSFTVCLFPSLLFPSLHPNTKWLTRVDTGNHPPDFILFPGLAHMAILTLGNLGEGAPLPSPRVDPD